MYFVHPTACMPNDHERWNIFIIWQYLREHQPILFTSLRPHFIIHNKLSLFEMHFWFLLLQKGINGKKICKRFLSFKNFKSLFGRLFDGQFVTNYSSSKKEYCCIQIQVRTGQNIKYTYINKVKNGPPLL
jgi:hypothetical protein